MASAELPRTLRELTMHERAALVRYRRPQVGVLVVARGLTTGSPFELTEPTTTLGRDPTSHVFLDDIAVSRRHAEIRRVGSSHVLSDSHSTNGTYLDGEPVKDSLLGDGEEIQIGSFRLIFFSPGYDQPPK